MLFLANDFAFWSPADSLSKRKKKWRKESDIVKWLWNKAQSLDRKNMKKYILVIPQAFTDTPDLLGEPPPKKSS